MKRSERESYAPAAAAFDATTNQIRHLNDDFRKNSGIGKLLLTRGITNLGGVAVANIIAAVRAYDDFGTDIDPRGEHDMGKINWGGAKIYWKIDYYDRDLACGSPDPTDPDVTTRVLTIMLASEY
jgi:hypothetical protein